MIFYSKTGACLQLNIIKIFTFLRIQSDSSVDGTYSIPLLFEKVPEINQEESQWTDCEIRNAINSIYQNLDKLDAYISLLVRSSILIIQFPAAHSISISKLTFFF